MSVKIIECPRDAMQGMQRFVPTEVKVQYLKALLEVGYDTIDCGSFVSPKAIPQMRDTAAVLEQIEDKKNTHFSVIVANKRGIDEACKNSKVDHLGFPFSISETFQKRNTNSSIEASFATVEYLVEQADKHHKKVVIYISMGFGNPYKDAWSPALVTHYVGRLMELGIPFFSISDTVGVSDAVKISRVFNELIPSFEEIEFGAHFHTRKDNWREKVEAAYTSGCKRFDGAILGYGGCPMAKDELVGNMPTEFLISYLEEKNVHHGLDLNRFDKAKYLATQIFHA
jgi:hydroxymethylglutaryl-CoA lyase